MRRPAARAAVLALLLALTAPSPDSAAFEFLDGAFEVHGFFSEQVRGVGRDLSFGDDVDLTQWYHVLNVEMEYQPLPDGWGPLDVVSFYARVEARYDCVWTRGCGLFPSANAFGDRAEHLPARLIDAHRSGYFGQVPTGDERRFSGISRERADFGFLEVPAQGRRRPLEFFQAPGFSILFGIAGPNQILEPIGTPGSDDPAPFVFDEILDNCIFTARRFLGPNNGVDEFRSQGPWNPGCSVRPIGRLRGKPNPLNPSDLNPIVGAGGDGELPFRAAPLFNLDGTPRAGVGLPAQARARKWDAQGGYVPNPALVRLLRGGELDDFDQNFSQNDLEWNRGASQQDEKELKELYADIEMFDSRLWLRIGKQNIVWGKTELFRTTDQFNPQDLALSSLPSLEESRIALWSARGVWSFYDVGPFRDVRLELALNYDDFEPNDLGRCGEPYTPNPVCDKTFGLFAHGLTGVGLAGEARPSAPWDSTRGLEVGARVEWRWKRFSFQLSDYYGYEDLPYPDIAFVYERNVDPRTGRMRRAEARAGCDPEGVASGDTSGCLGVFSNPASPSNPFSDLDGDGEPDRDGTGRVVIDPAQRMALLRDHPGNQTLFAMVCATSFGASNFAPEACGQNVFNTQGALGGLLPRLISGLMAGSPTASGLVTLGFTPGVTLPLVQLNADPRDDTPGSGLAAVPFFGTEGLALKLTPEQEALLGCGPFFGTHCDDDGIDLFNLETSALMQGWIGFEGTRGNGRLDNGEALPGTVGAVLSGEGGTPCTRFEEGRLLILPGCRGADYDASTLQAVYGIANAEGSYDPLVDGCSRDDGSPECAGKPTLAIADVDVDNDGNLGDLGSAIGQQFVSEMAAASFNLSMVLVAFSTPRDFAGVTKPDDPLLSEFDVDDPLGLGRPTNACSILNPITCYAVSGLLNLSGVQRNLVRAGGNGRFGRRDFIWHHGATTVLRYEKRNVLGFSFDWAEDRTKTNWGVEAAWIEGQRFTDMNAPRSISQADTYNLTVSVDRPTFVNFLNPNRTFLLNTQWFFQYVDGYGSGFTSNGPLNVLMTATIFTGYHQDRLLTFVTGVYDFRSNSGGFLPQVIYRFTENFSASVGMSLFAGRFESRPAPLTSFGPHRNRAGRAAYRSFWENGLSAIRDRDEINLTLRYTF